ncbi:MAG: hypothetical protein E7361_00235 [Clostridiales bacterium]|nr:hypothetical protein [Clostridiales bacterium]
MNCTKSSYLVKCEVPGCSSVATSLYSAGVENGAKGIAICNNCIKAMAKMFAPKKNIREE